MFVIYVCRHCFFCLIVNFIAVTRLWVENRKSEFKFVYSLKCLLDFKSWPSQIEMKWKWNTILSLSQTVIFLQ